VISKIELGQRAVQALELIAICKALELSAADVLAAYEREQASL
jgi:hypothetical protein